MLVALLVVAGCSWAEEPDLRSQAQAPFELRASRPAPAETGVPRSAPIDLVFSVAPDAESVADIDLRLFSGLIEAPGTVRVDLLERRLRMQPFRSLRPELRYQVSLSGELRGLNGARLPSAIIFDFTTGAAEGPAPAGPTPLRAEDLQPLWSARCVRCHATASPPMGLDLSSPDMARRSLRGVPASTGMAKVRPGDHARSYLMLKLLGEGGHLGPPMPPEEPRLSGPELRRVADWIDAGAL